MKKLAIFDIDGTLHKTEIMSMAAFSEIMPRLGLAVPSLETLYTTYGLDTESILETLHIPASLAEQWKELFVTQEIAHVAKSAVLYEGAAESLLQLYEQGIELALCSMCSQEYMDAIMEKFSLYPIIQYTRNETASRDKAELVGQLLAESRAQSVVMVGDRIFDIEAARANGVPSIGCLYGYNALEAKQADSTIQSAWDIARAVLECLA